MPINPEVWTKLSPHPVQHQVWTDPHRFKMVYAGRRSGKTELAKRNLVRSLPIKKPWNNPNYFAAAPTRDQAKRIFWKHLKDLIPNEWVYRVSESDLCVTTIFGSTLWVIGLDKPQRIEGMPWDGGVLDEYADMKPEVWQENVRPVMSDRNGWCWFTGVPEGFNHYKDLVDYAQTSGDPDWKAYTWFSSDILPESEIESAKRTLDARIFRQEYEGSFENAIGQVYHAFDNDNLKEIPYDPNLPIILCCDFNVDPCVWELAQYNGKFVNVFDEICLRNTHTEEMSKEMLTRYPNKNIIVYGDSAGSSRTTAGKSDYAIMAQLGLKNHTLKKANPFVKDRVNAMNAMLCNAKGERKIFINPIKCVELVKDYKGVVWKNNDIDKRDINRTHSSDAFGYYIEYEFGLNKKVRTKQKYLK